MLLNTPDNLDQCSRLGILLFGVGVPVGVCVPTCSCGGNALLHARGDQKSNLDSITRELSSLFLRASLTDPKAEHSAWLAGQEASEAQHLGLSSAGITNLGHSTQLFHGCWGSKWDPHARAEEVLLTGPSLRSLSQDP